MGERELETEEPAWPAMKGPRQPPALSVAVAEGDGCALEGVAS